MKRDVGVTLAAVAVNFVMGWAALAIFSLAPMPPEWIVLPAALGMGMIAGYVIGEWAF